MTTTMNDYSTASILAGVGNNRGPNRPSFEASPAAGGDDGSSGDGAPAPPSAFAVGSRSRRSSYTILLPVPGSAAAATAASGKPQEFTAAAVAARYERSVQVGWRARFHMRFQSCNTQFRYVWFDDSSV